MAVTGTIARRNAVPVILVSIFLVGAPKPARQLCVIKSRGHATDVFTLARALAERSAVRSVLLRALIRRIAEVAATFARPVRGAEVASASALARK